MSRDLDWPKIVMGGVVLLGAYAAYRLLVAPAQAAEAPQPTMPAFKPPPWLAPSAPEPPPKERPLVGPKTLDYLGDPVSLVKSARYRAVGQLSGLESVALGFVSDKKKAIADRFRDLGFSDVSVYESLSELPRDWPAETVTSLPDRAFFLEGTWGGESASIPKPTQIVKAWKSA